MYGVSHLGGGRGYHGMPMSPEKVRHKSRQAFLKKGVLDKKPNNNPDRVNAVG